MAVEIITSVDRKDILEVLSRTRANKCLVRITQRYAGNGLRVQTYQYKTGFPNGPRCKSVTGWYSVNYREDGLFMSSDALTTYISNINRGLCGKGITWLVEAGVQM